MIWSTESIDGSPSPLKQERRLPRSPLQNQNPAGTRASSTSNSLLMTALFQPIVSQDKFEQIMRELPQLAGVGCEVRVKGLGYSVQRAKGSIDEPTVGDNFVSLFKTLLCLPLIERLKKGKVS